MKGKKTGGRIAQTPNKISKDMRERIKTLIEKNIDKIEDDFDKLDSEKRLIVLEKYLKYCLPPLQSLDISGELKTSPPQAFVFNMVDEKVKNILESGDFFNEGN